MEITSVSCRKIWHSFLFSKAGNSRVEIFVAIDFRVLTNKRKIRKT